MTEHVIGSVDEFPEEKGVQVDIDGIDIAVFEIDGEFYGIQNLCPHKRLPLHPIGEEVSHSETLGDTGDDPSFPKTRGNIDKENKKINCPWHYLELDLESGEAETVGKRVATYDVSVRDGDVVVTI